MPSTPAKPQPASAAPMNGLLNALQERQQVMQELLPATPPAGQKPNPAAMQGLNQQMPAAERAIFAKDTGIKTNPHAQDIHLGMSEDELTRLFNAIMGVK